MFLMFSGHRRRQARYQSSSNRRALHVSIIEIEFGLSLEEFGYWGSVVVAVVHNGSGGGVVQLLVIL